MHDRHTRPDDQRTERSGRRAGHHRTGATAVQRLAGNAAMTRLVARAAESEPDDVQNTPADLVRRAMDGPAQQAPAALRAALEEHTGWTLPPARFHRGPVAAAAAQAVDARAFASGRDVVVDDRATDPETEVHELVHVHQHEQGAVGGHDHGDGLRVSHPDDPSERQARSIAAEVVRGNGHEPGRPPVQRAQSGGPGRGSGRPVEVMRAPAESTSGQQADPEAYYRTLVPIALRISRLARLTGEQERGLRQVATNLQQAEQAGRTVNKERTVETLVRLRWGIGAEPAVVRAFSDFSEADRERGVVSMGERDSGGISGAKKVLWTEALGGCVGVALWNGNRCLLAHCTPDQLSPEKLDHHVASMNGSCQIDGARLWLSSPSKDVSYYTRLKESLVRAGAKPVAEFTSDKLAIAVRTGTVFTDLRTTA